MQEGYNSEKGSCSNVRLLMWRMIKWMFR